MDQATLGLSEADVPCDELGRVTVHYARQEPPHANYPHPVVCALECGTIVVATVHPAVNGLFHLKLRCSGEPSRVARLLWIAPVEFVEVLEL
jgi:hypothetical protein